MLQGARAAFRDLLQSPRARVRLSTFALEHDAVVEPSTLLEEVSALALPVTRVEEPRVRASLSEALSAPALDTAIPAHLRGWALARRSALVLERRTPGAAGPWRLPRVSVSRLELYLSCPFKFFAAEVLRLEEPADDLDVQTPLERGRFLHELWERFFREWQARGHGRIDASQLPEARELFAALCDEALQRLSPAEAALERTRLLGSAVDPGIAHRVFAMEASRDEPIVERLLEFPLEGDFAFATRDGGARVVPLNAKTDRVDVLRGGRLRVIDYKSKTTPDPKVALQLPVYAHLARECLQRARGARYELADALYLSFEGSRAIVPLKPARGQSLDDLVLDAQDRLVRTLDDIGRGSFPPRPARKSMCGPCGYRAVCRLEIVAAETEAVQRAADDEGE